MKSNSPLPHLSRDSIHNCCRQVIAMYIVIAHHKNSLKHSGSPPLPPSVYHSVFHNPGYSSSYPFPIKLKTKTSYTFTGDFSETTVDADHSSLLSSSHPSASLDKWTYVESYNCSLSFRSRGTIYNASTSFELSVDSSMNRIFLSLYDLWFHVWTSKFEVPASWQNSLDLFPPFSECPHNSVFNTG